ncbi:hypothetical protein PR048_006314 [Dryococelus australis]|uniref:Uncharacterized protein n=1 Tax=Dryococelus australis TaxID=614101 RepID=A0ABQ9IAM9_9NEOP|nr:hypothetical protein PR048_006314 [Dryococelus australis]
MMIIFYTVVESCRTIPLVGGFSREYPVSPALAIRRCSILNSFTLIGSQDLDVKSHPNLSTPLHYTVVEIYWNPLSASWQRYAAMVPGTGAEWVSAEADEPTSVRGMSGRKDNGECQGQGSWVVATSVGKFRQATNAPAIPLRLDASSPRNENAQRLLDVNCRLRNQKLMDRVRIVTTSSFFSGGGNGKSPRKPADQRHCPVIQPVFEPVSPWCEARRLTAQPPRSLVKALDNTEVQQPLMPRRTSAVHASKMASREALRLLAAQPKGNFSRDLYVNIKGTTHVVVLGQEDVKWPELCVCVSGFDEVGGGGGFLRSVPSRRLDENVLSRNTAIKSRLPSSALSHRILECLRSVLSERCPHELSKRPHVAFNRAPISVWARTQSIQALTGERSSDKLLASDAILLASVYGLSLQNKRMFDLCITKYSPTSRSAVGWCATDLGYSRLWVRIPVGTCKYQFNIEIDFTVLYILEPVSFIHGAVAAERLDCSPPTKANLVQSLPVEIVPDDAAGRQVFSGIYSFPCPCIPALLHSHNNSPSSALKTSLLRSVQTSQLN